MSKIRQPQREAKQRGLCSEQLHDRRPQPHGSHAVLVKIKERGRWFLKTNITDNSNRDNLAEAVQTGGVKHC